MHFLHLLSFQTPQTIMEVHSTRTIACTGAVCFDVIKAISVNIFETRCIFHEEDNTCSLVGTYDVMMTSTFCNANVYDNSVNITIMSDDEWSSVALERSFDALSSRSGNIVRSITLHGQNISGTGDSGVITSLVNLMKIDGLEKIVLEDCFFDSDHIEIFMKGVGESSLKSLSWSFTGSLLDHFHAGNVIVMGLIRILTANRQTGIEEFIMTGEYGVHADTVRILGTSIMENKTHFRKIAISNAFTSSGFPYATGNSWAKAMGVAMRNPLINYIGLDHMQISKSGTRFIAKGFSNMHHFRTREQKISIELGSNAISPVGMNAILEGLSNGNWMFISHIGLSENFVRSKNLERVTGILSSLPAFSTFSIGLPRSIETSLSVENICAVMRRSDLNLDITLRNFYSEPLEADKLVETCIQNNGRCMNVLLTLDSQYFRWENRDRLYVKCNGMLGDECIIEIVVKMIRERAVAFASGTDTRLGAKSSMNSLSTEILSLIWDRI